MIVYYDSTGKILCAVAASSAEVTPPPNPGTPLYLDDTTYADVWAHPGRYLIESGKPVEQPYLTLTTSTANGVTTVAAALNNPPSPAPASVTFAVAGVQESVALANGSASIEFTVDSNLAGASIPLTVSAPGCVGASLDLGTAGGIAAPLQLIAPGQPGNTSTTAYRVATSSIDYALGAAASTVKQVRQLNAMAVALGLLTHALTEIVMPALQQASWKGVTLTADQAQALSDLSSAVAPLIPYHLGTIYPSGGSPVPVYERWKGDMAAIQAALQAADAGLAVPGLT